MSSIHYLAGFFDGDGCIRVAEQKSGGLTVVVSIIQKDPRPLYMFKQFFGVGTVGLYPQHPPYRHYTYFAYSDNASKVLTEIEPYLVVKREQANQAIMGMRYAKIGSYTQVRDVLDWFKSQRRAIILENSTVPA